MKKVGKAAVLEEDGSLREERLRVSTQSGMPLSTLANIDARISLRLGPDSLICC